LASTVNLAVKTSAATSFATKIVNVIGAIGVVVLAKIGKGSTVEMVNGPVPTVRVKLCVTSAPTPLCAVNISGKLPVVLVIPLSTPVEALNITPLGGVPDVRLRVGAG
jgi:hypothetical protein